MWKSLLLGLLVSLHTRIFLVFMRNYEAKSPLFMIKRAGLNYVPRQSYSKNSHGSYILKWILVLVPRTEAKQIPLQIVSKLQVTHIRR